jgi:hypothetical protein
VYSYFSESVKKWKDLNLSATFTEFYREVAPVSESLPQVIHHQERIMSLLEKYIHQQDPLSLSSLFEYLCESAYADFSMLVQFARDLGEDFYASYWVRTVALLSQTVNHTDFTVIEVTYPALAVLIGGCVQHFVMVAKVSRPSTSCEFTIDFSSACTITRKIPSETTRASFYFGGICLPPQKGQGR